MGAGGVLFTTEKNYCIGDIIELKISFPKSESLFTCLARVLRIQPAEGAIRFSTAAGFLGLTDSEIESVNRVVLAKSSSNPAALLLCSDSGEYNAIKKFFTDILQLQPYHCADKKSAKKMFKTLHPRMIYIGHNPPSIDALSLAKEFRICTKGYSTIVLSVNESHKVLVNDIFAAGANVVIIKKAAQNIFQDIADFYNNTNKR